MAALRPMRLFTAISLPPEILFRLDRLLAALRPDANIQWSPIDNLHVTTKFIGPWQSEQLPALHEALQVVTAQTEPFPLQLQNLGWFPPEGRPRVLWAGVTPCAALSQLAQATEQALAGLGIAAETRPYTPHLTLARVRRPAILTPLRQKMEALGPVSLGCSPVSSFSLYQSLPGSNGSLYRPLRTYEFGTRAAAASSS